jgi:hypothetical protein
VSGDSVSSAWNQIIRRLPAKALKRSRAAKADPFALFGLSNSSVRSLVEGLPGASKCAHYRPEAAAVEPIETEPKAEAEAADDGVDMDAEAETPSSARGGKKESSASTQRRKRGRFAR